MTKKEIEEAIAIIEFSRVTYVQWREWQLKTPDWKSRVKPESPGDPEHHKKFIEDYDKVLKVLHEIRSQIPAKEK